MKHSVCFLMIQIFALCGFAREISSSSSAVVPANTTFADGASVSSIVNVDYGSFDWDDSCVVTLNGAELFSSNSKRGAFTWQPRKLGVNTLVWSSAGTAITTTVNVAALSYFVQPEPNPPMAKDNSVAITPLTQDVDIGGGMFAVVTSGSGTWTAAVSEPWIKLNAASGQAGFPVLSRRCCPSPSAD